MYIYFVFYFISYLLSLHATTVGLRYLFRYTSWCLALTVCLMLPYSLLVTLEFRVCKQKTEQQGKLLVLRHQIRLKNGAL